MRSRRVPAAKTAGMSCSGHRAPRPTCVRLSGILAREDKGRAQARFEGPAEKTFLFDVRSIEDGE